MQMMHCICPILSGPVAEVDDCWARTAAAVWAAASSSSAEGASFVRSRCSISASALIDEEVALRRLLLCPCFDSSAARLRVWGWRVFEDEPPGEEASLVRSTILSPSHGRRVLGAMPPASRSVSPSLRKSSMSMPSLRSSESNEGELGSEGVKRRPGVNSPKRFMG